MEIAESVSGLALLTATGPLAEYEALLQAAMSELQYAPSSLVQATRVLRQLSRWMEERGVSALGLTPGVVEEFVAARRHRLSRRVSARWVSAVVGVLRSQGVVPVKGPPVVDARGALLSEFRGWLLAERGLAVESVRCYSSQAAKFLAYLPDPIEESLNGLDARAVTSFVVAGAQVAASVWSAKAQVTATRALLRFLHVQGSIPSSLTAAVPGVAGWRLAALPRGLERGRVEVLLGAHDLTDPVGVRDHAVLVVLARLGLRGAEVAALELGDVDWRAGEIVVRGKAACVERLPLPVEVGAALAAYLTQGRPSCDCRALIVTARAPYRPLTSSTVRAIMRRACRRAGVASVGAHRLRHSLATDLLRAGASLSEVGQVLRHRSDLSTALYAKVDDTSLRILARPWPGNPR